MNTKNNQRATDTKQRIQKEFIGLLQTTDVSKITVRVLCEKVGINRSSFYLHYADVYQLLDTMVEEKARQAQNVFVTSDAEGNVLLQENAMENLFYFVADNQEFYQALLHHNKHAVLFDFYLGLVHTEGLQPYVRYLNIENRAEGEYRSEFFKAGINAVLRHWVSRGCTESAEDMAAYVLKEYTRRLHVVE